jgi:hypothetical protein
MTDAGGSRLNIGAPVEKRGRSRPRGSKNKASIEAAAASSSALVKRHPDRPSGSKNKPKVPSAAPGPSAPSAHDSSPPPKLFSFFCIAGPQCRKIQRLPLNFTKFMDGRELREVVLREHSGGGTPYEVEVWYDGAGEQYFVVTQHTTACCSMQVVDITLVKYHFTNITSLRVVQQKHSGIYSST